eukprot:gene3157-3950_t
MTSIQNLASNSTDPFDDSNLGSNTDINYIHIRIFQRNKRKAVTTVESLPKNIDFKKILKHFKKTLNCNGNLIEDEQLGTVVSLQGDHRKEIFQFFVDEKILDKSSIKIHGF